MPQSVNTYTPLRFAILGFGNFAERAIAPAIRSTPGAALVAIQKRSADAARLKAKEYGVPHGFGSVQEAVAHPDVDAVFIVSANSAHCPETIAAAEAGKHVIVEKPMANSVAEAERMIAACARNGVQLMVGHMIRYSPLVSRMRAIVASRALGHITYARADFVYDGRMSQRVWLRDRAVAGGGPVFDIGVHCIDTLRYVLDDEVVNVCSVLEPRPSTERTEENAQITLGFTRGTIGSVFCSYQAPVRHKQIEIVGTDGAMRANEFTVGSIAAQLEVALGTDARPARPTVEQFQIPNLYVEEIAHFCDAIRTQRPTLTPGENGLMNQRILDRVMADSGTT